MGLGCTSGLIRGVSSSVDGPEDPKKRILAQRQKVIGQNPHEYLLVVLEATMARLGSRTTGMRIYTERLDLDFGWHIGTRLLGRMDTFKHLIMKNI